MPIYRIHLARDVTIVQLASVDIEASDDADARIKGEAIMKAYGYDWEQDYVSQVNAVMVDSVEILADGDEKISPRPQD